MASKNLCTVQRVLNAFHKSSKRANVPIRRLSGWTQDGIVSSPYKSIEVPNCTVDEYVWQNLDKWPKKTAIVCAKSGRGYTYEQIFKFANAFAANLRQKFKIQDGDAVAVMLPNVPEFPVVAIGILQAGGVITSINPIYTAHEVQRQLLMSNAKFIVTQAGIENTMRDAMKLAKLDLKMIVVRNNGDATPEGTTAFDELSEDVHIDKSCLKEVRRNVNDICFLPYSSGTTGLPKGVELYNRNLVANCEQMNEPIIASHNETTASHQDAIMAVLPFFHIYGASVVMFHKLSLGCKLVTLDKFHSQAFLRALEEYKINILFAAPPMTLLMASQGSRKILKYLEIIINGAAPLAISDINKFFSTAERKVDFRQGYGLTETSPTVAISPRGMENYGCVGHPVPNTDLKIVDTNMQNLGPNETGELLIRGPQVMPGYKDNPTANSEVFTEGGWFRSGDLAFIDADGILTIADRLKELIKVKGFQVPPAELEGVLREHPAISDSAVVGVPHSINGEAPKAFVVLKEGQTVQAHEITAFMKERVASYKIVEDIVFLESIPKSASGKILRRELKDKYC